MTAALSGKEIEQMQVQWRTWVLWLLRFRQREFPTQRALAKALGVTNATVTYWIRGTRLPSIENAMAVRRITGFPIEIMLTEEPPELPVPQPALGARRRGDVDP